MNTIPIDIRPKNSDRAEAPWTIASSCKGWKDLTAQYDEECAGKKNSDNQHHGEHEWGPAARTIAFFIMNVMMSEAPLAVNGC